MATLATLRAHHQEGLDALPTYDAYFDVGSRQFDASTHTLTMLFSQRTDQIVNVDGLPPADLMRRTWRFEEYRVPAVRCVLRIRHVGQWSAPRVAEDEPGMLDGIDWDEERSRVTVHTVTGAEEVVAVDRLEVEVEITDQVDSSSRCGEAAWGR